MSPSREEVALGRRWGLTQAPGLAPGALHAGDQGCGLDAHRNRVQGRDLEVRLVQLETGTEATSASVARPRCPAPTPPCLTPDSPSQALASSVSSGGGRASGEQGISDHAHLGRSCPSPQVLFHTHLVDLQYEQEGLLEPALGCPPYSGPSAFAFSCQNGRGQDLCQEGAGQVSAHSGATCCTPWCRVGLP